MIADLDEVEGAFLVKLARDSVTEFLSAGKIIRPPENTSKILYEKCGVFVTINCLDNGEKRLRGCIGYPEPSIPLVQAVIDSALNAATQDPRFNPVKVKELDQLVFEVSVLTSPELIEAEKPDEYINKIQVGKHGLIIERGFYRGLLLPQVPVHWGWCEEEFLCQCCVKAGLQPDSWLEKGTKIYRFAAIVFEEVSPKGEIERRKMSA